MLEESVEDGARGRDIADEFAPVLNGSVACHDRGAEFIAAHNDLEKIFSGLVWKLFKRKRNCGKKRWQTCRICLIFEPVDLSRLFIKTQIETLMESSFCSNELWILKIIEKGRKILC